jgi:DNA polymerase-3 subunit gamma/tau
VKIKSLIFQKKFEGLVDAKPSKYQVIARKYRPQTFASIVGQESIVTTLKNALRFNRLAHAYLFCGCRGTGKTTLARVFAKALNCAQLSEDGEPCNSCSSCTDIIAGRSLDVLEIDGASNRGIDDIRQINETIGYAPASGKYKIYIIDEVHMLTKEAFNALLKTLEEPPENVKFFFATTEPHKVLPTIISRCQRFDLNRIPFEALKEKLTWIAADLKVNCEEDVFSLVANLSEGSLRDAESLFDQILCYAEQPITVAKVSSTLGIMPRSVFFSLDKAFAEQNLSFAFELADDIFSSGKDLSYFIDNLIDHYRFLLKLKLGSPTTFPTSRLKEQYSAASSLYTEEQCLYILDFLIQWQQQIGKTPFKRISLEMILLHLLRSKHRIALPTLVKRLSELEQQPQVKTQVEPVLAPAPHSAKIDSANARNFPDARSESSIQPKNNEPIQTTPPEPQSEELKQDAATSASSAEKIVESPSLEETLLKKIRQRIEAAPSIIEETPVPSEAEKNQEIFRQSNTVEAPETKLAATSLVLTKSQWEAIASDQITEKPISVPTAQEVQAKPEENLSPQSSSENLSQSRYDTLVRFAAVELEGIIKKEQPNG